MHIQGKYFNRILVIDDDYVSSSLAELILEEVELAEQVFAFTNALHALAYITAYTENEEAASEACPDLILLDINMPQMDGYEFLESLELLNPEHLSQTRIVVLSNSSADRERGKLQLYKIDDFMSKPITIDKIYRLVGKSQPCPE